VGHGKLPGWVDDGEEIYLYENRSGTQAYRKDTITEIVRVPRRTPGTIGPWSNGGRVTGRP